MKLFHLPPIHIPTLLRFLDPGQLRVGLDHSVNGLADGLLIDLLDVDLQPVYGLDHGLALGDQFALSQGFVGVAFAFHREPGHVALALGMALVVQVFHAFEGDRAAALQGQVLAAVQLGDLVQLVAVAAQCEVASSADFSTDVGGLGDFVALGFFRPEAALCLHVVQGVCAVLRSEQAQSVAAVQVRFVAGGDLAGDKRGVAASLDAHVVARCQLAGELGGAVVGFSDAFFTVLGFGRDVVNIARRTDVDVLTCCQPQVVARPGLTGQNIDIPPRINPKIAARCNG